MVLSRTTQSWVCVGISGGAGVGLGPQLDHKDTLAPAPMAPQLLTILACTDMCQTATSLPWIHLQGRDGTVRGSKHPAPVVVPLSTLTPKTQVTSGLCDSGALNWKPCLMGCPPARKVGSLALLLLFLSFQAHSTHSLVSEGPG